MTTTIDTITSENILETVPLFGEIPDDHFYQFARAISVKQKEIETFLQEAQNQEELLKIIDKYNKEHPEVPEETGGIYEQETVFMHGIHVSIRNDRRGNIWLIINPFNRSNQPQRQPKTQPVQEETEPIRSRIKASVTRWWDNLGKK